MLQFTKLSESLIFLSGNGCVDGKLTRGIAGPSPVHNMGLGLCPDSGTDDDVLGTKAVVLEIRKPEQS